MFPLLVSRKDAMTSYQIKNRNKLLCDNKILKTGVFIFGKKILNEK